MLPKVAFEEDEIDEEDEITCKLRKTTTTSTRKTLEEDDDKTTANEINCRLVLCRTLFLHGTGVNYDVSAGK